ncbi:hypothetical protein BDR07DRAFT_1372749 [Suillus spraguei]|nr:hypothetical protein BDR07DRAFT_1372749 [Suillus spraguei]
MTLLHFIILLLIHIPFVCSSLPSLNGTSVTSLDIYDSLSNHNSRSLWDIVWSCAATLFACTWTAIHPNIPGMNEGKFTVLFRRLGFMMIALLGPEIIITWAAIQFLCARTTANAFNDAFGWTVTHGFFAWMGGFMLYFNDNQRATLTPDELLNFLREGSVDIIPVIAEADIEDWSKAALIGIAYGFWWKKPKDVGRPHAVYWKAATSPPSELTYDKVNAIFSSKDWVNIFLTYIYPIASLMGTGIFNSPRAVHSRRVPSAGGYDRENARRHRIIILLIGSLSGAVFGNTSTGRASFKVKPAALDDYEGMMKLEKD